MKRPSDEELVLYYYGEADDPAAVEAALEHDEVARRWRELRAVLDAVPTAPPVPERDERYGDRVWERLEGRLGSRGRLLYFPSRRALGRLAAAAALAAALGVAFWLGSRTQLQDGLAIAASDSRQGAAVGESASQEAPRVLLLAVADHLDRTEMLLVELANRDSGVTDLSAERQWAEELTTSSRLYREAAQRAGEGELALLLRQLEPLLTELAHEPEETSAASLEDLRDRLREDDLLFKVRVVGSRLNHETHSGALGADV